MSLNIQSDFFGRFRLGTPGTVARTTNAPITTTAIASGTLKPGQGVILKSVSNKLTAVAATTTEESLQIQGVILIKPSSVPTVSGGDIEFIGGEVVDVLVVGFVYVATSNGATQNPFDLAAPDFGGTVDEWLIYVPSSSEQRIKPIMFIEHTELDDTSLNAEDLDTQLIYVPDRALDRAVDSTGTPIAN